MGDRPNLVCLRFETVFTEVPPGSQLGLCGSLEEIGKWNSKKCALAEECPPSSGHWVLELMLPPVTSFEWKWVVVSNDRSKTHRWEERSNRILSTGVMNGKILAPWNNNTSFSPDVKTSNLFITSSSTKYKVNDGSRSTLSRGASLLHRIRNPCVLL